MLKRLRDPRAIALVLVGALAIGSVTIGPAIGVGPFTKKKAKRIFYTKSQADARFAQKSRVYTKSQSDSRYPSASGTVRITEHAGSWEFINSGSAVFNNNAGQTVVSSVVDTNPILQMPLTTPQTIFGRAMRVSGFEFCYDTTNTSQINEVALASARDTAADPVASTVFLFDDVNIRTDSTCRTYTTGSPTAVDPNDQLTVFLDTSLNGGSGGDLTLGRVSLLLRP